MSVYVDNARHRYGRMVMCHMLADTVEELHTMADAVGMKRKWFQGKSKHPHYDICLSMKYKAIENGAVVLTGFHEVAKVLKRIRK